MSLTQRDGDERDSWERRRKTSYNARDDRYSRSYSRHERSVYSSDSAVRDRSRRRTRQQSSVLGDRSDHSTRIDTRRPERSKPVDRNGEELTIDVDLNTARGSPGFLHAKTISRQPTSRILELEKELERRYNFEKIDRFDILASRTYLIDGKESALLDYRRSTRVDTTTQFRWIHVQSKVRSLANFEHLASRLQGIDESEPILITRLMQKVRNENEKVFPSGPSLEPLVLRCDGRDPRNREKEDKWVIFMCVPYLAAESQVHEIHSEEQPLHRTIGLLQSHYRLELTPNLEKEQVMRQYGRKDLHVSQIWIFILSSGVILTCSPDAFTSMLGPSLRLNEANETSSGTAQSQIRMLDPHRRLFLIPLEECRTWFALIDRVIALCHREFGDKAEDYRILRQDGKQIEAVDWEEFYINEKGSFIDISVQCMTPEAPPPPKSSGLLRDEKYSSNSSDSDSTDSDSTNASVDDSTSIPGSEHGIPLTKTEGEVERFGSGHATHRGAFVEEPENVPSDVRSMALVPYRRRSSNVSFLRKGTMRSDDQHRSNDQLRDDYQRRGSGKLALSQLVESPRGHHRAKNPRQSGLSTRSRSPNGITQVEPVQRPDQDGDSKRRGRRSSPSQALVLRRRHPLEYNPHRGDLPPNRVIRYPLPPPDDVIVNAPAEPAPDSEIEQAYYISRLKKRTEKRRRLGGNHKSVSNTQEGNTSRYAIQDNIATNSASAGNDEGQNSGGHCSTKVHKPEVNVPPVFLWPSGKPSARTTSKSQRFDAQFDQFGGENLDELPGASKVPNPPENVNSSGDMNDEEMMKVILENVHRELGKNKDYNLSLISETKFTQGKLYKAVNVASRAEVTSTMKGLLSHREKSDVFCNERSRKSWQAQLNDLADHLLEIFDFFLPADSTELVAGKYWGAMMRLFQIIAEMCEPQFARRSIVDTEHQKVEDVWLIIDISKTSDFRIEEPTFLPTEFIMDCEDCRARTRYRTMSQAVEHLRQWHFSSQPVPTDELKRWIANTQRLWDYQICADAQKLIDIMLQHCIQLRMLKNEIRHGVCVDGKFDDSLYSLPSGLVKAFQRLLILIVYVAHTCSVAYKQYERSRGDASPLTFIDAFYTHHIEILGYGAEGSFDTAKDDLMLMSGADDYSRGIAYEAVGPEYVVLLLLNDLLARTNAEDALDLHRTYREYAMRLDYQSRHHPRKRLLSKINFFQEELQIVADLTLQQAWLISYVRELLRPYSFKVTSRTRRTLYSIEANAVDKYLDANFRDQDNYGDLRGTVDRLAQKTTQQVEIQQEDHGKAILVFTVVTIVFLPLSFVTGLLGMNTADIRNQTNGQWLFWAIALPLTAIVLVLSVLIGYRSDQLRGGLEDLIFRRQIKPATIVDQRAATYEPESRSILSADSQKAQAPPRDKGQTEHRSAEDNV